MKTVEEKIMRRCGKDMPFRTPEGYFDTLSDRIISNVAKHEESRNQTIKKPLFSWGGISLITVAACIAGIVFFIVPATTSNNDTQSSMTADIFEGTVYDEDYQKEVLNYAMIDESDVYSYLAGTGY